MCLCPIFKTIILILSQTAWYLSLTVLVVLLCRKNAHQGDRRLDEWMKCQERRYFGKLNGQWCSLRWKASPSRGRRNQCRAADMTSRPTTEPLQADSPGLQPLRYIAMTKHSFNLSSSFDQMPKYIYMIGIFNKATLSFFPLVQLHG